jgi:DNA-binding NarL/FixJ family response regulator
VRILVISQHDESLFAERSIRAGASGYVMKQEATNEVITAIRTVLAGDLYVSRRSPWSSFAGRSMPASKKQRTGMNSPHGPGSCRFTRCSAPA